jgi:hypothetical protein
MITYTIETGINDLVWNPQLELLEYYQIANARTARCCTMRGRLNLRDGMQGGGFEHMTACDF